MDSTPRCPPCPPLDLSLSRPSSRSNSSCTTIKSDGCAPWSRSNSTTADPLRFIKVWGLAKIRRSRQRSRPSIIPIAVTLRWDEVQLEISRDLASASIATKPILCRLPAYFGPGFPSPTRIFNMKPSNHPPLISTSLPYHLPSGILSRLWPRLFHQVFQPFRPPAQLLLLPLPLSSFR